MGICIPLLKLLADVTHKFEGAIPIWGNLGVYHPDKIFDSNQSAYLPSTSLLCASMSRRTTSTILIFLSPQFLVNHHNARDVFVECAHECMLWVIAMDKAHIHVQHGTSFHKDVCALRAKNFWCVYGNQLKVKCPQLITLSTMFLLSYIWLLLTLLTADLSIGHCIINQIPSAGNSHAVGKSQFVAKGLTLNANFLLHNPDLSVFSFLPYTSRRNWI
jgi:hypothetical protein